MAAFTSNYPGAPTSGFYNKGDVITDSSGNVWTCTVTGYAGPVGVVASSLAQFAVMPVNASFSAIDGLTAFAGGGQASALALTKDMNRVTTVATAADSVKLPAATPGKNITVVNAAAANAMNVFPQSGEAINALANDAAFSIPANKTVEFSCELAGKWHSILTA